MANYEEFRKWRQEQGQRELDALWHKELITSVVPGVFRFEYVTNPVCNSLDLVPPN